MLTYLRGLSEQTDCRNPHDCLNLFGRELIPGYLSLRGNRIRHAQCNAARKHPSLVGGSAAMPPLAKCRVRRLPMSYAVAALTDAVITSTRLLALLLR